MLIHQLRMSKGFTIIELAVVIAIVAIISAVAAPRFANVDIFSTRGDAGLLESSLRYAQKTALAQRRAVYLVYRANVPPSLDLCFTLDCSQTVRDPLNGNPYTMAFSRGVAVTGGTVGFDALGRPIPNVNASYTVKNASNLSQSVTIVVEAESGYIHK